MTLITYPLGLAAVDGHGDLLLDVGLEQVLEGVVVLVQPRLPDGHDEVEEGLEAGPRAGRVVLDAEDVVALRPAAGDLDALTGSHGDSSWITNQKLYLCRNYDIWSARLSGDVEDDNDTSKHVI